MVAFAQSFQKMKQKKNLFQFYTLLNLNHKTVGLSNLTFLVGITLVTFFSYQ